MEWGNILSHGKVLVSPASKRRFILDSQMLLFRVKVKKGWKFDVIKKTSQGLELLVHPWPGYITQWTPHLGTSFLSVATNISNFDVLDTISESRALPALKESRHLGKHSLEPL